MIYFNILIDYVHYSMYYTYNNTNSDEMYGPGKLQGIGAKCLKHTRFLDGIVQTMVLGASNGGGYRVEEVKASRSIVPVQIENIVCVY